MSLQLYAMTCGWLDLPLAMLLDGEKGRLRVPVPSYLIVHPKGRALFDSGLGTACQSDAEAYMGPLTKIMQVEFWPGEEVSARLERIETGVGEVDFVVNSHLHFDHAGGNAQIPDARLVVQRREWEAAHREEGIESGGYKPVDYDCGHDLLLTDGEHDLFGDGSAVLIPTYGHTPGHQSARLRLEGGEVVLTGDACYLSRTLRDLHLPTAAVADRDAMLRSLRTLRELQARGARIFYGHDPEFWQSVPQAPAKIA